MAGSVRDDDVGTGSGSPVLHTGRVRIAMADSDHAGLIYYSRPFEWQEALTGAWLATQGRPVSRLIATGHAFPVVTATSTYHRPTGLDDELRLELHHLGHGRTSFVLGMSCLRGDDLCIEVAITHVWSEHQRPDGQNAKPVPVPLPDWLRDALGARHRHEDVHANATDRGTRRP